jgi:serine/threonine-protein kinase
MSPEQTRGDKLTSASDIFSLAVVIYELVTGQRPFAGDSIVEIMHAVATVPAVAASRLRIG